MSIHNSPLDQKIHVCHVASALKGGSEIMISQLVAAQLAAGYRVTLVYSPLRDELVSFRHLFPADVAIVPWAVEREVGLGPDFKAYKQIREILLGLNPGIVHLHNSKAGALGRIVCRLIGIPCIYTPHGLPFLRADIAPWKRALHFAAEWVLALFGGRMIALSQGELAAIRFMPCRKALINNGVDVDAIRHAAKPPDGKKDGGFRIVLSGRIDTPKNPSFVAAVAAQSPEEWDWIWVGEGPLDYDLKAGGRVNITGWVTRDVALSIVQSADVFLQASLWEGMSFALLEAMALERPCVVSNVVGNRDLIMHGSTGYVCEEMSDYLLALNNVASDADKSKELGEAGLRYVRKNFDLEVINRRWDALYKSLLPRPHQN